MVPRHGYKVLTLDIGSGTQWHQSAHTFCQCPGILPVILYFNCQHVKRVEMVEN